MKSKYFLIVAGLMLVLFSYSSAQVPELINYQGKLTKASGAPLDTTISMVFSIYADSAGTILKWTETQGAVVVEKGIFNVLLGSVNLIPDTVFNGSIRYLGVKVGGDPEITPRKPMVSVPYAYRAGIGGGADNDWTINGDTIYHLNGNVGIGTTNPQYKLDILDVSASVVRVKSNSSNSFLVLDKYSSSAYGYVGFYTGGAEKWDLGQYGDDNFQLRYYPTSTVALYANTAGNVGIGTTTPNEQLELTGNFRLPPSTASVGVIKSGANRFIHNFGSSNFFAGVNAGNLTLSGTGGNTGVGFNALKSLTTGNYNTAVGGNALDSNTTGYSNTAVGQWALTSNTTGANNAAMGRDALLNNTTGYENTAAGQSALTSNTTGWNNTAVGLAALWSNITGTNNTVVGYYALFNNTKGTNNTAIGYRADVTTDSLTNATAIGANTIVGASNALVLGGTGANAVNVGIGTITPQGALDVTSTTGALIVPRMTTAQRDALTAINGMIIYNTITNQFNFREAGAWVTK